MDLIDDLDSDLESETEDEDREESLIKGVKEGHTKSGVKSDELIAIGERVQGFLHTCISTKENGVQRAYE